VNAFKPKGRKVRAVKVLTSSGWKKRTTGTKDPTTARKMQRMVDELRDARAFDVLDAIGAKSLSVPATWDLYRVGGVAAIRTRLADVDLLTKRAGWLAEVRSHASEDTAQHYAHYLSTFAAGGIMPRSVVTAERLRGFLAGLQRSSGTRRKYHAGLSSFFAYCVAVGTLERNPLADVKPPAPGKPRDRHLSARDAKRLADAQPSPYRELSALLAGSGIEVGVALALRVRDVDVAHREIRARGTKTHNRDRIARVAEWAWEYVQRAIGGKTPDAHVFGTIADRWAAQDQHTAACKALGITDYTMRDARHTWAVRMARAGTPIEQISKQLGHKDAAMALKVYGVYTPTQRERDHWEQIATAKDHAEAGQ
jgi:integrase